MNVQPIQTNKLPLQRPVPQAQIDTEPVVHDGVNLSQAAPPEAPVAEAAPEAPVAPSVLAPVPVAAAPETPSVFAGWQVAGSQPTSPTPPPTGYNRANMDPSVDPAKDFFGYAMGNYLKNHPIPPSESSWGVDAEVVQDVRNNLHTALDEVVSAPRNAEEQRLGDFYQSGMDMEARDRAGLTPLQGVFDEIAGLTSVHQVQGEVARLQKVGINPLFEFGSGQDAKDQSQVTGQVYQGGLGLPDRDYYFPTDAEGVALRDKYRQHIQRTFQLTGQDEATATLSADTVMRLETRLAEASMTKVELRDPVATYNPMETAKLNELTPHFDWSQYFSDLGRPDMGMLNMATPKYFAGLDKILGETPLEDFKTYLNWTALRSTASSLSTPMVDENFAFRKELTGAKEQPELWKTMVQTTDDFLGDSLGKIFVQRHFPPEAKAKAEDMVGNVITALRERITNLDWMSAETKTQAMEKLDKMHFKIGYPDTWKDYGDLKFDRANYGGNVLAARAFLFQEDLARIGAPVDKTRWLMTPSTVNAYYDPSNNEFVMPAAILQPPYFDLKADDALNYGCTAATIGHEITHGFDDQGALYDAVGNMRNWWTEDDKSKFDKLTGGVEKQFSEFQYEGIPVDGKMVLGESVADLGGLEIALRGYQLSREKNHGQELPSPDGFTPEQRFFLGYAQSWGTNLRYEKAKMQIATDPHPLPQFRVVGPLANLPEFHEAFAIPPGTPMYRPIEQRNHLWT